MFLHGIDSPVDYKLVNNLYNEFTLFKANWSPSYRCDAKCYFNQSKCSQNCKGLSNMKRV